LNAEAPSALEAQPAEAVSPVFGDTAPTETRLEFDPGASAEPRIAMEPAGAAHESAVDERQTRSFAPAQPEPEAAADESTPITRAVASLSDQAEPAHPAAPALDEPPRPRRNGWWQRARATIVGN
jgi:ribonuclease E